MTTKKTTASYLPEMRERAVRLVLEGGGDHPTQWVRQAERDGGQRPGSTSAERERIEALEREVRELRQVNEILRKASAYFAWRSSTAGRGHDRLH